MGRRLITAVTAKTGSVSTFTWGDVDGLTGPARTQTLTATGGTGTGARFNVTRSGGGSNSLITSVTLFAAGSGYTVGDNLTVTETLTPFGNVAITVTAVA